MHNNVKIFFLKVPDLSKLFFVAKENYICILN